MLLYGQRYLKVLSGARDDANNKVSELMINHEIKYWNGNVVG